MSSARPRFFALVCALVAGAFSTAMSAPASDHLIYLGTYTRDGSQGIYSVRLDDQTGALSAPLLAAEVRNPTFLAAHPNGRVLYALTEVPDDAGGMSGGIAAFTIDAAAGKLTLLNRQPTGGGSVTHLVADDTGRELVAVSYGAGYVVSFPLEADGRLGARGSFLPHAGPLGPNKIRQDKPHAHSATLSPDNRFVFVADLGLDRVLAYRLDPAHAALTPHEPAFLAVTPGSGPRHSKFSADGRFFYVLGEIDGSVTTCAYDAVRGIATPIQHLSTLPVDFKITNDDRAAEIRLHPNGRFVYASNRGHDSIAVFARDAATGRLTLVEITPSGGKAPRNFALSRDGRWLVAAHQDTNNLTVFRVDAETGRLTATTATATVPRAVCVYFAN